MMNELELLESILKVNTSIYHHLAFIIYLVLPLCAIIWFLGRVFKPFIEK